MGGHRGWGWRGAGGAPLRRPSVRQRREPSDSDARVPRSRADESRRTLVPTRQRAQGVVRPRATSSTTRHPCSTLRTSTRTAPSRRRPTSTTHRRPSLAPRARCTRTTPPDVPLVQRRRRGRISRPRDSSRRTSSTTSRPWRRTVLASTKLLHASAPHLLLLPPTPTARKNSTASSSHPST